MLGLFKLFEDPETPFRLACEFTQGLIGALLLVLGVFAAVRLRRRRAAQQPD
jgi:hypothetical protein